MRRDCDFLVLGSGIAGLSFALAAAEHGRVVIVTKRTAAEANTWYAQGGIAAVTDKSDSFESHVEDTVAAGAGLCDRRVVEMVVREGPDRVNELVAWGVHFTHRDSAGEPEFDLGREGGHSHRRILHASDMTGQEIEGALLARAHEHPDIEILERCIAIDLLVGTPGMRPLEPRRCWGAYVLDIAADRVDAVVARMTVLATGGAGKVYLYTSNPDVASGDGVAMAYRAGAEIANMEFYQFHPTCLYHPEAKSFLISEAVRGEGAELRNVAGEPFMKKHHPMGSLAPRDVIARAIDTEMKRTGAPYVLLDATRLGRDFIALRFPHISEKVREFGFDMAERPLPVVPAAHYMCGGVRTDEWGRTSIDKLYAIGEVACTGLHGANRLASNSLLEGAVFAHRAAVRAGEELSRGEPPEVPEWFSGDARDSDELVVVHHNWEELRHLMWNYVGVARSTRRLERAKRRIDQLLEEIAEYYWDFRVTGDLVELRNIAVVADLIITSAWRRRESRGLHYNIDFPEPSDAFRRDTVLVRPRRGRRSLPLSELGGAY